MKPKHEEMEESEKEEAVERGAELSEGGVDYVKLGKSSGVIEHNETPSKKGVQIVGAGY